VPGSAWEEAPPEQALAQHRHSRLQREEVAAAAAQARHRPIHPIRLRAT